MVPPDYVQIIGYASGALTTIATVPQVVKVFRTKSTKDLSKGWVELLTAGTLMWAIYGVLISSLPIIISNGLTCILAVTLLVLKVLYK